MVHAGLLQDRRIDEHDVGHGEEGGEAGAELGADGSASFGEAKETVEEIACYRRRGDRRRAPRCRRLRFSRLRVRSSHASLPRDQLTGNRPPLFNLIRLSVTGTMAAPEMPLQAGGAL